MEHHWEATYRHSLEQGGVQVLSYVRDVALGGLGPVADHILVVFGRGSDGLRVQRILLAVLHISRECLLRGLPAVGLQTLRLVLLLPGCWLRSQRKADVTSLGALRVCRLSGQVARLGRWATARLQGCLEALDAVLHDPQLVDIVGAGREALPFQRYLGCCGGHLHGCGGHGGWGGCGGGHRRSRGSRGSRRSGRSWRSGFLLLLVQGTTVQLGKLSVDFTDLGVRWQLIRGDLWISQSLYAVPRTTCLRVHSHLCHVSQHLGIIQPRRMPIIQVGPGRGRAVRVGAIPRINFTVIQKVGRKIVRQILVVVGNLSLQRVGGSVGGIISTVVILTNLGRSRLAPRQHCRQLTASLDLRSILRLLAWALGGRRAGLVLCLCFLWLALVRRSTCDVTEVSVVPQAQILPINPQVILISLLIPGLRHFALAPLLLGRFGRRTAPQQLVGKCSVGLAHPCTTTLLPILLVQVSHQVLILLFVVAPEQGLAVALTQQILDLLGVVAQPVLFFTLTAGIVIVLLAQRLLLLLRPLPQELLLVLPAFALTHQVHLVLVALAQQIRTRAGLAGSLHPLLWRAHRQFGCAGPSYEAIQQVGAQVRLLALPCATVAVFPQVARPCLTDQAIKQIGALVPVLAALPETQVVLADVFSARQFVQPSPGAGRPVPATASVTGGPAATMLRPPVCGPVCGLVTLVIFGIATVAPAGLVVVLVVAVFFGVTVVILVRVFIFLLLVVVAVMRTVSWPGLTIILIVATLQENRCQASFASTQAERGAGLLHLSSRSGEDHGDDRDAHDW
mmetsp:Transcript_89070/g.238502  ORF Transcript_89070/g.238502 Transcript_89070/m.238502 type:complete len:791 (+) Transcript_89070:27-2399(+)